MLNYKVHLSYDGTCYSGFQVQQNATTIQGVLQQVLQVLYKREIKVTGAGRTDAGVHAREQVVSFKAPPFIPLAKLPLALNSMLPPDIRVWHAEIVADNFNACRSAREKTYRYTIDTGFYPDVFRRLYTWHYPQEVDFAKLEEAARYLVGTHDFTAFKAAGSKVKNNIRTITDFKLLHKGNFVVMQFTGDGFLYKMVRIMIGTLLEIGQNKKARPEDIEKILQARDRDKAGVTAPPHGLCLWSIKYR
ncbi:MAG: tRNA pseudouridine(38-40) synthase TruA [Firmicutes bacterium]|nr:tRNA pseudouridine(38-40) synthase TruA [Bacillota bacterium]